MPNADEIRLHSGHWLRLQDLRQFRTYEGLLEGLPTVEGNRKRLEHLVKEHRDSPYPGEPHLIRPTEKPLNSRDARPYPFGTPSALPSITCIGRFTSPEPARDPSAEYSGLVILWFQEEFAMPIDPAVVDQIRALDWKQLAADLWY